MNSSAWKPLLIVMALFGALLLALPWSGPLFHGVFPRLDRPLYTRAGFTQLTLWHLALVAGATLAATIIGVGSGILVTRPAGQRLQPLLLAVAAIGQTVPPVAVLAIMVPILGYEGGPTVIALFVYALLPIIANTVTGLEGIDPAVKESADGMGFQSWRRLLRIDLPLAAPVILAGIRTAAIINVGTATIGSTVGALTLGSPIIEGLSGSNPAYVIQGSLLVGLLAVFVDKVFDWLAVSYAGAHPNRLGAT